MRKPPGDYGTIRCYPSATSGESSIGFYRNNNGNIQNAGDFWAVGHQAYNPSDRNFGIGCHGAGLCLSITPTGVVNIPVSLQVANYGAGIRPFVSCAVPAAGGIYWSRGQKTASCLRESTGVYLVSWPDAHPDGEQYVPQYCLLNGWGLIRSAERTNKSIRIMTASYNESARDLDFWFTLH